MYFQVEYPSGKYRAASTHEPDTPEWPPHPSRVFSALVASGYQSKPGMTPKNRKALEWLERQPPPRIAAPRVERSPAPICYVPPGDSRRSKGAGPKKEWEHGIHRWRQPRNFPSANILGDPKVFFEWEHDPPSDLFSILDTMAAGITHVGTSHAMALVTAHRGKVEQPISLKPDQRGNIYLRIPASGRLDELDAVFNNCSGVRRPTPTCERITPYRKSQSGLTTNVIPSRYDFFALRISDSMHGADTAAYLSKAVRRAVMSILGDEAPSAVHGHGKGTHVAWLPLADVGHAYAKGRIIGIGVAISKDTDPVAYQQVLVGVQKIQRLRLSDGRIAKLTPLLPGESRPVALNINTWIRPSRTWATVTPVVLDRPPKRLTEDRIKKALLQSLEFAGLPEPQSIAVSGYSQFQGAPRAVRVPHPKPRYHAVIRLARPIAGPVMAGRLRNFGIGLFRPLTLS